MSAVTLKRVPVEPHSRVPHAVGNGVGQRRRDEIVIDLCEALIDVSAALFNVSSKELRSTRRTALNVSRVRQIAMYVGHVVLGLSMYEVGRGFSRDRTTVTHSCHLVEDMRDDVEFDQVVAMVERVVAAAFRNRPDVVR